MPYLERPHGRQIYYELDDYTDPWKKAPVILLQHGFSRSSKFWYCWVPYLSRYYRVVRPDMRGLGKSGPLDLSRDVNLDAYLSDLDAIIDHVGADSVHYCGESIGGLFGMIFAAQYPHRVRTLSLISAPVFLNEHDRKTTTYGYASRIEALQKMGPRAWAAASNTARRFPPDADPGLLDWYADEMGKGDVDLLVAMTRWVYGFTAAPYLPKIQAPVLGLYPTKDPIVDDEQLRVLREGVPNFTVVHLNTPYHMIQHIAPATCAKLVLHFAARYDGISCHE